MSVKNIETGSLIKMYPGDFSCQVERKENVLKLLNIKGRSVCEKTDTRRKSNSSVYIFKKRARIVPFFYF